MTAGAAPALAQNETLCADFVKNDDNSWSAIHNVRVAGAGRYFNVLEGALFKPGAAIMGFDLAAELERTCPQAAAAAVEQKTAVELPKLAAPNGTIDAGKFTCGELASTFQQDADFLVTWAIGWRSGQSKLSAIDVTRSREQIHRVIAYCKVNKDKPLTHALDVALREAKR
jgi:hypothetical protein